SVSEEWGSRELASCRDAADDIGNALRDGLAGGDVVGHEQRLRASHNDVVDDHTHQVLTDRVVDIHGLGNGNFGTHTIGRSSEHRTRVAGQWGGVPDARKPTETTQHSVAMGCGYRRLRELN